MNALARQLIDTVVPDRAQDITGDHLLVTKEILIRRRETDSIRCWTAWGLAISRPLSS